MTGGGTFLAIGECMVEMSPAGAGLYRRGFAGDTFNTAWYARRILGPDWSVGYLTCIGTDAVSSELTAFMAGEGIDTGALRPVPDRTVGLYMISIDGGERSFSYWRSQSAARLLADDAGWLEAQLASADIVYFSGITLAILAPDRRTDLSKAIRAARGRGALVAFDTNLRPRLWEDRAAMQAGIELGASLADIVLPSFDEETGLFSDATPDATIARYRALGATTIAVKNGSGEVTLWTSVAGRQVVTTDPVKAVVDTTAAGDSFAAAFVSAIAQGIAPDLAATRASELAGRVIQHPGALVPALFSREGPT